MRKFQALVLTMQSERLIRDVLLILHWPNKSSSYKTKASLTLYSNDKFTYIKDYFQPQHFFLLGRKLTQPQSLLSRQTHCVQRRSSQKYPVEGQYSLQTVHNF